MEPWGTALIGDPARVSTRWLTAKLRGAGALPTGDVEAVRVVSSTTTPASTVTRLAVGYGAGAAGSAASRLFLKTPKPGLAPAVTAQLGRREVRFYRDLAATMSDVPLIRCYSADCDAAGGDWHLLLDDVTKTHAQPDRGSVPTLEQYRRAIGTLAAVHAGWWGRQPPLSDESDREQPDEPPAERWREERERQVDAFASFLGDRLPSRSRQTYNAAIEGLPGLRRWRAASARPTTVVHGDAHLWNFLFPRTEEAGPVYLCDWQDWWIGEPTRDVAYLLGLHCDAERRREFEAELLREYHAALEARGVGGYPWDECWDDYRYSLTNSLFVAVGQWEIGLDEWIWWPNLERAMRAFEELGCEELLRR